MIVQSPDPVLSKECGTTTAKVGAQVGKQLKKAHDDYQAEHPEVHVVGMAAPQIGVSKRVFFAFGEVFVNPFMLSATGKQRCLEGCCSTGDEQYETERYHSLVLTWLMPSRGLRYHKFEGSQACIIQHELDHLKGILISDHGKLHDGV